MKGKRFFIDSGEYHSFDAYYKGIVFKDRNLIIPYINLGIFKHPLNPGEKVSFINKCYIILEDIQYLKVYKLPPVVGNSEIPAKYEFFFGGLNLDQNSIYIDIDVKCNQGFLELLPDSRVANEMWIPHDTPNFKANMDIHEVNSFFQEPYYGMGQQSKRQPGG